jgi:CDP-diacylglycerol--serine O-phosphatidyltransferase
MFCGMMAILNVLNVAEAASDYETHRYILSCWLILAAAVLDLMDGLVARLTHSESLFGAQLDSLADVVAFGVAPAVLIYTRMSNMENQHIAESTAIFFAICGALRLARFNVQKTKVEKKSFTGLPIPAGAGVVVSSFLFFQRIDPDWDKKFVLSFLPLMMIILAFLMVSTISYPSFKQLKLERRKQFDVLPIILLVVAILVILKEHLEAIVFFGFVIYVVCPVFGPWIRRHRAAPAVESHARRRHHSSHGVDQHSNRLLHAPDQADAAQQQLESHSSE